MSPDELEQELRAIGAAQYHDKHPFHKLLHGGKLNKGQVQAWALNRYCYQSAVPRKDAALMSRCHDRELRREWIHRIMDHDGYGEEEGGIERWLYRIVRKHAGRQPDGWRFDLPHLHLKSGSLAPYPAFAFEIRRIVAERSLPGYALTLERANGQLEILHFRAAPTCAKPQDRL